MTDQVLVLRALGLGDLLASVPALRALRRALPTARMTIATPGSLEPLLRLAGVEMAVHDHLGLGGALPRADLGVNLHGRGPQSHRLLRAAAPRMLAFGNAEAGVAGPEWRPDEHERERWCRLVGETTGMHGDPGDVALAAPPSRFPGTLVVHPGASLAARRWPVERFAYVVRWAGRQGIRTVITGSRAERGIAGLVARLSRVGPVVVAGRTDVAGLAGIVAHARAVLVGDTGVGHLASAYGTPSVHLFGPGGPAWWGPVAGPHTVLWRGDRPGDRGPEGIEVREVIDALESLIGAEVGVR